MRSNGLKAHTFSYILPDSLLNALQNLEIEDTNPDETLGGQACLILL